jgi:GT2 family glycosyltransferase
MSTKKKKKKKPVKKRPVNTFPATPRAAEHIEISYDIKPAPDEITTDIILVLYGDRKDLDRCVVSIKKYCNNYNLHIIDNNKVNRGFTKACNMGILGGDAPYVWLLNQDAIVLNEETQEALIERFNYGPKVGIAGSMQIDPDDRDIIRHGGVYNSGYPAGIHKGGRISMGHCRLPEKSIWINFASVMFRREMIRHIGLLDENMFLLFSDSDYCYWARYRGWEVWYEPRSQVLHRLGAASKSASEWHQKDRAAFMDKWGISSNGVKSNLFQKLERYP